MISGPTGCGKTTQVPQYILEEWERTNRPCNIIVTQPRKIAAQSVAKRVCQENGWSLGSLVGYKVGLDKANVSKDTKLLYCTTGMFKKMIIGRQSLEDWTHVILDEVHERELDMDFVLLLCRKFLNTNSRGVKLIVMSATIDVNSFKEYFSYLLPNGQKASPGWFQLNERRKYKVDEFYLESLKSLNLVDEDWPEFDLNEPELKTSCIKILVECLKKLEKSDKNMFESSIQMGEPEAALGGAVLVFLPGEPEIQRVKQFLERQSQQLREKWWIVPLHSRIPSEELQLAFQKREGRRKIILATNVAESSITIPDVTYVVDFCLTKRLNADRDTNYVSLQLEWADKNSLKQRFGRAGRVSRGMVFRLINRTFYDQPDYPSAGIPEMLRAPLDKILLDSKLLDSGSPPDILALAMNPPLLTSIHQ